MEGDVILNHFCCIKWFESEDEDILDTYCLSFYGHLSIKKKKKKRKTNFIIASISCVVQKEKAQVSREGGSFPFSSVHLRSLIHLYMYVLNVKRRFGCIMYKVTLSDVRLYIIKFVHRIKVCKLDRFESNCIGQICYKKCFERGLDITK